MTDTPNTKGTVLLAGATGAIGRVLLPMLIEQGYTVVGTTRDAAKQDSISAAGGKPAVVDVFDRDAIRELVQHEAPSVVVHQLTDLAGRNYAANSRLRVEGTRNLVDAAKAAGVRTMVAQSISFVYAPISQQATEEDPLLEGPAGSTVAGVKALEGAVAEMPHGVVLRYGILYGPGTWNSRTGENGQAVLHGRYEVAHEVTSFIHVEDAARAATEAIGWQSGIYNVADDDPAPASAWLPVFAEALGAPVPEYAPEGDPVNHSVSNYKARNTGWSPLHPTWRTGFFTALG